MSTRLRTPGEGSAPSGPARCSRAIGAIARDGGSDVNSSVPATTLIADTISAAAGEPTAAMIPVSSGPTTKISSISTESSA